MAASPRSPLARGLLFSPRLGRASATQSPRYATSPRITGSPRSAASPRTRATTESGVGQSATIAVLKSQLRLEQHRTASLEERLQKLRAQLTDPDDAATEESLRSCELQLRNEQKRRSAAETALKLAKREAFKVKKALSETRETAQERINAAERRYGETTRKTNKLEAANQSLRKQVKALEDEIQQNFEETLTRKHSVAEELRASQAQTAALQQQLSQVKQQLSAAIHGNKGAVGKERAAKQKLKAALTKSRLETGKVKTELSDAQAKIAALTLARSTLQKQIKSLKKSVDESDPKGLSAASLKNLLAQVSTAQEATSKQTNPSSSKLQRALDEANEQREKLVVLAQREQEISRRLRDDLKQAQVESEAKQKQLEEMEARLANEKILNDQLTSDFKKRISLLDKEVRTFKLAPACCCGSYLYYTAFCFQLAERGDGVAELEKRAKNEQARRDQEALRQRQLTAALEEEKQHRKQAEVRTA